MFAPQALLALSGVNFGALSVAVGDLDGDGIADLAAGSEGNVNVLLGTGKGTFGSPATFAPSSAGAESIQVGAFSGDGGGDLVFLGDGPTLLLGNGTGSFGAPTSFAANLMSANSALLPAAIAIGDFNEDGKADLAVANNDSGPDASEYYVIVLLGTGTGSFQPPTTFTVGAASETVVTGDLNGDGHLDLVVGSVMGQPVPTEPVVGVLRGTGTGSFGPQTTFSVGGSSVMDPIAMALGDFNGDGNLDLVVLEKNAVYVLLGTGTGAFGSATTYAPNLGAGSVAVADFNGDGILDLAFPVNGSTRVLSVGLGVGDGSFGALTSFGVGSSPVAVAVGDFNGDHWPDVVVANEGGGLSVLLNTCQ